MIKSITITNELGDILVLEMGSPEKSGFFIRGIDGLGPPRATVNTTELVTNDGSLFNSSRASSRNIVFRLGFLPSPTVEETRHLSYKMFPIKKQIGIVVETDTRVAETSGFVESNEPDIFSKDEGAVISVICPNAYFYSTTSTETIFSGLDNGMEFPFGNESLTLDLIEFGNIHNDNLQTILYNGDSEIGIVVYIHAIGDVEGLAIYNSNTREVMRIDSAKLEELTGDGIIFGDDIVIVTIKSQKGIYLVRNGIFYNILNALDKDADWFNLSRGDNIFAYTATSGAENLQFRIENQTVYEGV